MLRAMRPLLNRRNSSTPGSKMFPTARRYLHYLSKSEARNHLNLKSGFSWSTCCTRHSHEARAIVTDSYEAFTVSSSATVCSYPRPPWVDLPTSRAANEASSVDCFCVGTSDVVITSAGFLSRGKASAAPWRPSQLNLRCLQLHCKGLLIRYTSSH